MIFPVVIPLIALLSAPIGNFRFPIEDRGPFTNTVAEAASVQVHVLQWQYPDQGVLHIGTNIINVGFNVWGTTNILKPLSQWDLVASGLPGTTTQYMHRITNSRYFYTVSAYKK